MSYGVESPIGFVGLGVMGGPMAGHLRSRFANVWIWNRTPAKVGPWRELGCHVAESLEFLGEKCSLVFTCVRGSEDVREVLDRLTVDAPPGALYVDHSTILPAAAQAIHRDLNDRGFRFIDAPITGGSMGAQKGQLTIFCGGDRADFDEIAPVLSAYAKRAEYVGRPGAGQMMKMANQIAVGGALIGLCESMAFAKKAGLDLAQTRELLAGGAAGSWAFENYGPKLLERDWTPGFSIDNQVKDFAYCEEAAKQIGASLPMTHVLHRLLRDMQAEGHGDWTTAALFEKMLQLGGEVRPE